MSAAPESALPRIRRRAAVSVPRLPDDLHPVVRRVYATRGVHSAQDCDYGLQRLLPPDGLLGLDTAADVVAKAIADGRRICIAGDYDCDGAS
ncbi:MAG: hypothetical protein MRY60_09725, partial [Algiphilus sp.]|nr:hypothetical protein [Algiphilus sp.]